MPTQIQWRRGNTAQTAAFTGAIAEVTVDTDKKTLIVHDGVTPGGYALAKEASQQDALAFDTANAAFAKANNEAGVNATQNTNITNAQNTATAAFIRANNSLNANTGGQISGNLLPTTTNTYYLGSDANRWHSLYVGPGSIDLGGLVLSNQNGTLAVSVGGQSPTQISGSDQVARNTANAAFASANNVAPQIEPAFATANGAFAAANAAYQSQNATGQYANAAFIRANNSLDANVGGIVTGNVTVTQNLTVTGNISVSGNLFTSIPANGNTSAYATKYLVEYNPISREFSYSSTPDASSPYITGYSQEIHVSPVAFNDSGKGTIGDPVKTIARAIQLISPAFETTAAGQRKTIILHPGDYAENITIDTQFTVLTTHELVGKNTTLSGTLTISKGCTIEGLKMTNLVISATAATGAVDLIGCTVTTSVTKTSSAYTVFRGCDLSSATLSVTGAGNTILIGGNYGSLTVNNASAGVLAKAVVTMGPITLTAGTLQIADTIVYSATNSSNAITQSAGSVLTLNNSQILIPDLTNVSRVNLGGFYSILHSVYDKTNSTFGGTSLNAIEYSQYINADKVTLSSGGSLVFPDSTIQITAAAPFAYANAAFIRANNSLSANNGGTITGDVSITGNLSVLGNTFTVSATTIVANDTVIVLGNGNYTSDLLDIGISAHYNDGVNAHTGLIRDHGTKEWQLFEGYTGEIGANNDIIITDPSFKRATLNANLKSQSITLNNQNLQTYIDGAYNTANASFASANNIDGINTTQNNSITAAFAAANTADVKGTSAGIYANGAFAAANTADVKGTSAGIYANGAFKAANSNYTNAVTKLNVTNSGASAFLIDQYSGNNPTIYVRAGETIAFNLNVTGHPFMIRVSSGGSNYDTGLTHVDLNGTVNTESNAQGKETGVLYWKVPFDLVGLTYVYQCSVHGGMVGNIVIEQPTVLAFNHANAAFTYANTLNPSDTFARNQANAAFLTANTANNTANLAYANSYFPFGRFRIFNVTLPGGYYYLRERRDPSQNSPTIVVTAGKTFAFELQDLVGMSAALRTRPNYFGDSSFVANVTHISTTGVVTKNVTTYHTSGTLYWDIPLSLSGNSTIVISDPVYNAGPIFLRINDESKADYAATTANAAATSTFAGAAYGHANAAFLVANAAFSAGSYANSAFLVANAAFSAVSQSYNVANSSIVSTKLWSWGRNDFYKLGLGNAYVAESTIYSPIQVGTSKDWKKITGGSTSTAGLKTDGSIWVWGSVSGILGDSSATASATSPIQAAGGFNWKDVECGAPSAVIYGIKTNGTLWAWGNNTYGQLGHGNVIARSSPVQVGSATNWNKISFGVLGAYVAAAIKDDGTLWIWGDLTGGQAGDSLSPSSYYRSAPVQVGSAANWKEVNCKGGGIRAIKTDGTLWAWGNNTYGQLGDGTAVSKSSPVQVGSSTNWSKVDHGLEHTMALKTDGTLWTWGRNNSSYQLGDGTLVSRSSPVQTSAGGTNWKSISAGDYHSTAIKTDDSLWLWGFGGYSQLQQYFDTGNQADPKSPVTYPLFNYKQVYAHSGATFAIVFEYNS